MTRLLLLPLALAFLAPACQAEPTQAPGGDGPAELRVTGGDGQNGLGGVKLSDSLELRVLDEHGRPLNGVAVEWQTVEGHGDLVAQRTLTDGAGFARNSWTPGPASGDQLVEASVGDLSASFAATAADPVVGRRYTGREGYVEYEPGDLPVIISAPHGGWLRPDEIPDRSYGAFVTDANTYQLAGKIADALEARVGARPHLISLTLQRRKLDANRAIEEAAQESVYAEQAWHEYHDLIDLAKRTVTEAHGEGFYMDVHGHGHEIQMLELGYLLRSSDLERSDAELEAEGFADRTSVRTLADTSPHGFVEILRGATSLGALYQEEGYPSVPGPLHKDPGGAPYFSGGYNTRRHGSIGGGPISGFQLEANRHGVRDSEENRRAFAEATAAVLERFFEAHNGVSLTALAEAGATASAP
jgi:hypothetical protein